MKKINDSSRILVVDDIPKNLQVLGNILKEKNYSIEFALDGPSAIKWIEKKEFDLILLDIMMPGMTGFEVCSKIRRESKYDDLPIIFLTAKADTDSIVEGFKQGGQDYITKPFDSSELLARVNTHLELKNAKDILKNMNAILDEKVIKRTAQLTEANHRLQKLDDAKTTFLNIISHEIRTPLNGILGSLSLIKHSEFDERTQKFISLLDISANRLENFTLTTLDISFLVARGANAFRKKPLYLEALFRDSEHKYSKKINDKSLLVNVDNASDTVIALDENYISKVNNAILDNAIKYSEDQGTIEIKIWEADQFVHFRITDEGRGFDKDYSIEKILPFDSEEHIDNNPGLSLYLSRLIIKAHGGLIWCGNNKSKGAFVEYQLPID